MAQIRCHPNIVVLQKHLNELEFAKELIANPLVNFCVNKCNEYNYLSVEARTCYRKDSTFLPNDLQPLDVVYCYNITVLSGKKSG